MKKGLLAFVISLLTLSTTYATIHYDLSEFEEPGTKSNIGLISIDGKNFIKAGLSPDLKLGPIDLGIDANIYLPQNNTGPYPSELSFLTLRYVGYNHKNRHGFKYGRLNNVTLGYGLLMDGYDTGYGGSSEFTNNKAGFYGYATISNFKSYALWTASNVKGGRLTYTLPAFPIKQLPIIFGATYLTDSDGINETYSEKRVSRKEQSAYGVDIGVPIFGELLTSYIEYTQLENHGRGASIGFKGSLIGQVNYRAEYRKLGTDFVPGYFSNAYEATSFDFETDALDKAVSGFLVAADTSFMQDHYKAGLMYEKYDDRDLLTAAVGWRQTSNTVGVINYTVPFQGKDNATSQADILYITGKPIDYVISIKRIYLTSDSFTESYSVGVRFNMDKLFPSLPF